MIDAATDGIIQLTHRNRDPSTTSSEGDHPPAMCDHEEDCGARDYCGHARSHTKELMYDNCTGHHCTYRGEYVKCMAL